MPDDGQVVQVEVFDDGDEVVEQCRAGEPVASHG
jgi:hypothetical protein